MIKSYLLGIAILWPIMLLHFYIKRINIRDFFNFGGVFLFIFTPFIIVYAELTKEGDEWRSVGEILFISLGSGLVMASIAGVFDLIKWKPIHTEYFPYIDFMRKNKKVGWVVLLVGILLVSLQIFLDWDRYGV